MRADQVVEVIVSAGPVSPMDEMVISPAEFFPMSIEAIVLNDEIEFGRENLQSDSDSDSEDESEFTA